MWLLRSTSDLHQMWAAGQVMANKQARAAASEVWNKIMDLPVSNNRKSLILDLLIAAIADAVAQALKERDEQLAARQIWIDQYANQTETAIQQRDEACAEFDQQAEQIANLCDQVAHATQAYHRQVGEITRLDALSNRLADKCVWADEEIAQLRATVDAMDATHAEIVQAAVTAERASENQRCLDIVWEMYAECADGDFIRKLAAALRAPTGGHDE